MSTAPAIPSRKAQIDALLLKLPGVSARKINRLDAYFVSDKMFACTSGKGIGLRDSCRWDWVRKLAACISWKDAKF